ncbi:RIP homotypic interaction motif-containing protein [Variovorax robiniae]|uniref:RIP homotypic interaction motif-containing protein n=1 Tax=Variovorax robiniae TaxID=1836199 RepID=A0ABU8X0E7_9BURK
MNDTVFLESRDGSRAGPFKTAIGSKNGLSASIFQPTLDVEEGCKLIRPLPSGKEEFFTVLEANYSPGLHTIPAHWTLKLKKDGSMVDSNKSSLQNTTINITNSQGIQIGDHNLQHIASSLIGLVEEIESCNATPPEKATAKGLLRDFMGNPVVAAVLGSATSGVLALLG